MATALDQIRQQYPQYKDVPDRQLADALYAKFYEGKIDKPAYYQQLGLTTEDREKWGTLEKINNAVNQFGTGAYKGIAGLIGLPGTLADIGAARGYGPWLATGRMPKPGEPGYGLVPGQPRPNNSGLPSGADVEEFMTDTMGIPFAPRETTGDKLLQTGGAGATAVIFPGSRLQNLASGVAGSEASEVAGMATEGTKYEPAARLIAGLLGGVAGVAGTNRAVASSVEDVLNRATMGYTRSDFQAAARLQEQARSAGTQLTAAEALAQVKGGNRGVMALQRYAEQHPDSEPIMSAMLSQRAQNNAGAAQRVFDLIGAPSSRPSEVGGTINRALNAELDDRIAQLYGPMNESAAARLQAAENAVGPGMSAEQAGEIIQRDLRRGADVADQARATAAAPGFTAARSSDAAVNTDGVTALAARYMAEEKGHMQELAQQALATMRVGGRIAGAPDTSVTGLMASRRALNSLIETETRAGNREGVRMLMDIRTGLDDALAQVPDVAAANDTFSLLSRNLTDRYGNPTVAPIIERDQFGRSLVMPEEKVPGRILSGPSAVDDFIQATTRESSEAMQQFMVGVIRRDATDAAGNIDPRKLRAVMNRYDAQLSRFPDVRERFENVASARAQMDEAQAITSEARAQSFVGQMAQKQTAKEQAAFILGRDPKFVGPEEVADAMRAIASRDPQAAQQFIRQILDDTYAEAAKGAKGQADAFGGAKFTSMMTGNTQAARNLEAAIRSLPNGDVQWRGFRNLLDIFEAQGQRMLPGSPTEFNRQMTEGFARSRWADLKSFGVDMMNRLALRRRTHELASVLTNPDGVRLLEQLAQLGPQSRRASQLVSAFFQTEQNTVGRQEPRLDIYRALGLPLPKQATK